MIDFTIETRIERPVDEVFAYATDPDKLSTWQTNTVSVTKEGDAPLGVGTRLHEIHRAPAGKQVATVVEVSEYRPDEAFGLRMVDGTPPIHAQVLFEPSGGGTLMRFRSFGQPTGVLRLLEPVLRRALRRQFAAHCDTLRRVLESPS
jgi:uncharacterized protein YndB with AHSA1/START domain